MTSDWFCLQLGAREHYAVARALRAQGCLAGLVTEAWVGPRSPLRWLPVSLTGRLGERFHRDLAGARVGAFTRAASWFELRQRRRGTRGWPLILARNLWFQRHAVRELDRLAPGGQAGDCGARPVLFAYSYAAREPLRWAKQHGWRTVLCQIDPGPLEIEIVAAEQRRHPEISTRWQAPPPEYWSAWREECALADVIVANSEWSRDGLVARGIPADKIQIVPLIYERAPDSGAPVRSYPERFTAERPLRVLFLGQVNLRKGVAYVLEAARSLRGQPIEFQLAGPPDFTPADADRTAPNLAWIGPVRRSEVGGFYRQGDVFLFPTLSDGFGLTQLEAQAHGLPVIASTHCGRVVRDGLNGFVLPEVSAPAVAEVLLECLRNPPRLAAMSARSQVAPEFSPESVARRLLAVAPARAAAT